MISCNLLELSFNWNFNNKGVNRPCPTSFGAVKYNFVIKIIKMFNFLPLINSSFTIELSLLLLIIAII